MHQHSGEYVRRADACRMWKVGLGGVKQLVVVVMVMMMMMMVVVVMMMVVVVVVEVVIIIMFMMLMMLLSVTNTPQGTKKHRYSRNRFIYQTLFTSTILAPIF